MIQLHFYLDTRASGDGPAPVKLAVCKRGDTAFLPTGVRLLPTEWDAATRRAKGTPRARAVNTALSRLMVTAEDFIRPRLYAGELAPLTAGQIRDLLRQHLDGGVGASVGDVWEARLARVDGGTAAVAQTAVRSLTAYDPAVLTRPVTCITPAWLSSWAEWLRGQGKSENSVRTWLRAFGSAWSFARAEGKVSGNPFEGVPMASLPGPHRNLTREQMAVLLRAEPTTERERLALDAFALSFYLRAANFADLWMLTRDAVRLGRWEYKRQKTGTAYSVKMEREAAAILARYGWNIRALAGSQSPHSWVVLTNGALKAVAARLGLPPSLSTYWARHSLATYLLETGASMEVVSAALGHQYGARVTAIYAEMRDYKVDAAVRRVYDLFAEAVGEADAEVAAD